MKISFDIASQDFSNPNILGDFISHVVGYIWLNGVDDHFRNLTNYSF